MKYFYVFVFFFFDAPHSNSINYFNIHDVHVDHDDRIVHGDHTNVLRDVLEHELEHGQFLSLGMGFPCVRGI